MKNKNHVKNKQLQKEKQQTELKTEPKQKGGQLSEELSMDEQLKLFSSLIVDHLLKDHYENSKEHD